VYNLPRVEKKDFDLFLSRLWSGHHWYNHDLKFYFFTEMQHWLCQRLLQQWEASYHHLLRFCLDFKFVFCITYLLMLLFQNILHIRCNEGFCCCIPSGIRPLLLRSSFASLDRCEMIMLKWDPTTIFFHGFLQRITDRTSAFSISTIPELT